MMTTRVLTKLFFENLIRDKFFVFVIFSGLLFGSFSIIFNEISYGATEMVVRSFCLGFVSITMNFLGVFFGLSIIHSDSMKHSILLLICKPIRKFEIIISAVFAYIIAVLFSILVILIELHFILNMYEVAITVPFLMGVLGIFFESIVLFILSVLFRTFANSLISAMFVFCLYWFSHSFSTLIELTLFKSNLGLSSFMTILSKILPDFSIFDFKHIAFHQSDYLDSIYYGSIYFVFTFLLIGSLLGFLFSNKDYD